jgi:hypothetical protein
MVFRSTLHFIYLGYKYGQHHACIKYSTACSASLLFIWMNRTDAFFLLTTNLLLKLTFSFKHCNSDLFTTRRERYTRERLEDYKRNGTL